MPYKITRDTQACSASKPFAVKKQSDDKLVGCHATRTGAKKQMAALLANEPSRVLPQGETVNPKEIRYTPGRVELRRVDGDKPVIAGYAAVFNKPSRNLGGFIEVVRSTAFNRSRGNDWPDVVARYEHDDKMLLGTTAAGTLRLRTDDTGLEYEVTPPAARSDVTELVERGDVRHSSFAFRIIEDDWGKSEQGYPQRSLISVQLVDVAPVNAPAYPDATAAIRSLAKHVEGDFEEIRKLLAEDKARTLFNKTGPKPEQPKTFGPAARAEILGRENSPE